MTIRQGWLMGALIFVAYTGLLGQEQVLSDFIKKGIDQWEVPGLAVAIVHRGETVFMETHGVTDFESMQQVSENTLGMMGSTTKAVTALAMALLVDQGRITWQTKVRDILPDFHLADPLVERELNVADLLCHRAGFGNTDLLWVSGLEDQEVTGRMRFAELAYPFRAGYTYQNVMYALAGQVIEELSGMPWEDFVSEQIFSKIGMERTVPFAKQAITDGDYLRPHYVINGQIQQIEQMTAENIAPAGDIWSSLEDMQEWIHFWLDSTKIDEKRLLSKEQFNQLFAQHTIIPRSQFYGTSALSRPSWTSYGLGWFQQDYRGDVLQFHTGSLPGLVAIMGILPAEEFGIYVFANLDHAELRHAIMFKAIDLYVHADDSRDWNEEIYDFYAREKISQDSTLAKIVRARVIQTSPTLPLEAYEGTFVSEMYGTAIVSHDGQLRVDLNANLHSNLEHWHYDTFTYRWNDYRKRGRATFSQDENGLISSLKIDGVLFKRE